VRLAAALTVVASVTHGLVVVAVVEAATEPHWLDVVHDLSHVATLHAQRMHGEVGTSVLAPLRGVVPRLLVPALVHLLALAWLGHAWHQSSLNMHSRANCESILFNGIDCGNGAQ
jgi:hypothetical protein